MLQVAREAHFSGQSYLDLAPGNVPNLKNNFYTSFSFRTEQKEGLMFYHHDQVGLTSCFLFPVSCWWPSAAVRVRSSVCVCVCVQDGVCQVFLYEGHVVVRVGNNEIRTQKTYNDDNSHYVAIYSNANG